MDRDLVIIVVGAFLSIPIMAYGLWLTLHVDHKIKQRGILVAAGGACVQLVMDVMVRNIPAAAAMAAVIVMLLHLWWGRGGGDGLKKRLTSWAQSFGRAVQPQPGV